MKNFKLKWLLVLVGVFIASINTAWAVKYQPTKGVNGGSAVYGVVPQGAVMQSTGMQSQQIMSSGSAYTGTVYAPFSGTTPSEANNPAKAPGGPRRGYNPETGEWTPDAPDIETAGDYGQSNESPIGEPWVMALFALAFAGVIAIRQYKRKTVKSMNMKNSTSKFIATLALLCTIGVGQMWASNTYTIYCLPKALWGDSWDDDDQIKAYWIHTGEASGAPLMTSTGCKYDGKLIYKVNLTVPYDGVSSLTFQRFNSSGTYEDKYDCIKSWWGYSGFDGKMYKADWSDGNPVWHSLDWTKYSISSGITVYFDNTDMNMSAVQLYLGQPNSTSSYTLTRIAGTPYYYKTFSEAWSNYGTLIFRQDDSWTKQTADIYQNVSATTCFTPNNGNNKTGVNTTYIVGPKALSKTNTTTVIRGAGTSDNHYFVAPGTEISVSASGTKIEDSHTVQYKFNDGAWGTTSTFTRVASAVAGTEYQVTVYVRTTDGAGHYSREFNLGTFYYTCEVYTVAGTPTSVFGGSSTWDATRAANDMVYSDAEGKYLWQEEIVYPASAPQYKVTKNHGWTTSYPKDNQSITGGTNGISYNVTISYDPSNNDVAHSIRAVPRTVTFDKESGTGGTDSQDTYYGESPSNITPPTRTGYTFAGYYDGDNGTGNLVINSSGVWQGSKTGFTDASTKWIVTSNTSLYAKWTPITYYVRFNGHGNTGGSMSNQEFTYDAAQSLTSNAFTKTGYSFDHWDTQENDGGTDYTNGQSVSNLADEQGEIADLYAQWTPNPYTVYLDLEEDHQGTIASKTTSQDVTYDDATTTVPAVPTGATGYAFDGFYTDHNGGGTKVINADGTWIESVDGYTDESKNWVHAGNVTLYAYYKNAQITNITFSPTTAAGETKVVATPTISPTPEGTTYICWKLFNNAECTHETEGHTFSNAAGDAELNPSSNSNAVSFITPAHTGSYYVQAILRSGNDCGAGEKLDSVVYQYIVASDHTVKIKYMCDGVEIAPRDEVIVPAAGYKGIKALSGNDVFGYQFSSWSLGDGLTNECVDASTCGAAGKDSIYISAVYNGTLTANYTKKQYVYLDISQTFGTGRWSNPHAYLYTSAGYWDSSKGAGATGAACIKKGAMTLVPGETDIYYFDYGDAASFGYKLAFTWGAHELEDNFDYADVIYRTDMNAGTTLFVPVVGQTEETKNGHGHYFSKGYWRKYEPATGKTGYTLKVYDKIPDSDRKEVRSRDFVETDVVGKIFEATVDLEANTTYGIKFIRDNDQNYTYADQSLSNGTPLTMSVQASSYKAVSLTTNVAGSYKFTLACTSDGNLTIQVDFPATTADYRMVYNDLAEWSLGTTHTASWCHPSRVITRRDGAEDIISFFVKTDATPRYKFQKITGLNPVAWSDVAEGEGDHYIDIPDSIKLKGSGVYNFHIKQEIIDDKNTIRVVKIEPYTGNYYIRTDNAGSTKWSDYIALDHQMTYSEYAQNSGYTHYYMHYCQRGTNVKFCIANDYSPCISDTLIRDITKPFDENMDENGFLYTTPAVAEYADKYSANIRFMWNENTNKISRAYLSSAQMDNILVLTNNGTTGSVTDENDVDKSGVNIKFKDDQNWIYEAIVKVKPSAGVRLKVFARYSNAGNTATKDQYLIGSYNSGTYDASSSESLLTGSGDVLQTIRILYDFKTNRLVKAWMPTAEIEGAQTIDADLMIVREHQQSAQNILLTELDKGEEEDPEAGSLTTDKKIYAVMRFNRWILSNRANPNDKSDSHAGADYYTYHPLLPVGQWLPTYERSLYYISFPFDVKISEIFGFGNYGTHYAIQRYDGEGRAKNGYWVDSDPNWKWVPPTGTLKAYEGYVLSLSMSNMDAGNTAVWTNKSSEIELYFPSSTTGTITIQNTNVTIGALDDEKYKCTIERDKRNIKDSYWRCIGVPSYADYSGTLTSDGSAVINWQKEKIELPFIYEINWQDKSLTPYVGTTFPFKAMHSYLVQYGGEIHWTNVVNKPSSIVAREKSADIEQIFQLELSQDSVFCDRTFVRMIDNEDITNNFDFNHDLSKETNAGRANIWTMTADSVSAAGNSMPFSDQTTIVPVGIKIVTDGDYTFAMPEGTNGVGVILIDNIAGTRTNLSLTDYTVNLTTGTYDGRFSLEISPIADVPSDVEAISDQHSVVRKVMVDGILYIVKDGKVFDARGNRVQ